MQKPLQDFFEDLTIEQRNRILELIETLPEDVQSVVFPKTYYRTVADPVDAPLATYWVDMEAYGVIRNIHTLNIDISPFFNHFRLADIVLLLKSERPEHYLTRLAELKPESSEELLSGGLETLQLVNSFMDLVDTFANHINS